MKRKSLKLLLVEHDQLSREEMIATIGEITRRLHAHFRKHIGLQKATYPVEIFEATIGYAPEYLSIYQREYWWNIILKIMSGLRGSEELFVIHRGQKWFVLQSKEEAKGYKNAIHRSVITLLKMTKKADRWVKNENWKNI